MTFEPPQYIKDWSAIPDVEKYGGRDFNLEARCRACGHAMIWHGTDLECTGCVSGLSRGWRHPFSAPLVIFEFGHPVEVL